MRSGRMDQSRIVDAGVVRAALSGQRSGWTLMPTVHKESSPPPYEFLRSCVSFCPISRPPVTPPDLRFANPLNPHTPARVIFPPKLLPFAIHWKCRGYKTRSCARFKSQEQNIARFLGTAAFFRSPAHVTWSPDTSRPRTCSCLEDEPSVV